MTGQRSSFLMLLAAAGLAASQSISGLGLSQQCQNVLTAALANPNLTQCLNTITAINIFTTTANTSIVPAVDNWLKGVCAAAPCDNSTLTQAAQNITSGCQSDLSNLGISSQDAQNIVNDVVQFYPTVRKVACLETKANNSLCVTDVLDDLQAVVGPLSTNNIVSIGQGVLSGNSTVSIPKSVTCNDCTEAAWAIIKQDDPAVTSNTQITGVISNTCGSDFLNATQPTDVVEAVGSATPGAALGSHITFDRFLGVAAVPLFGMMAGSSLLF